MKIRPLHDRVGIRRAEDDTKSKAGIIIPDNAKEKPRGEMIAVGSGARDESGALIALDANASSVTLFGKWSGTEVKIDGENLLMMKEAGIMGIIERAVAAKKAT